MEIPDSSNSVKAKEDIRQNMLIRRAALNMSVVEINSAAICHKLDELKAIYQARTIMGFYGINQEVRIMPFLEEKQNQGKTILLPRVEKNGHLSAVKYGGLDQTRSGSFGIMEPVGEPYPPENIDVVIVPGLAFDYRGYRIGYGKGYYDRFLPGLRKDVFLCGVCYDFQIVENIFPQSGDIAVQWIITEQSELMVKWEFFNLGF